jgi:phage terminase small subunit
MNQRQISFIEAYIITGNATKAARMAGYSAKTAQETGSKLLSKVIIQEALAQKRKTITDKFAITAENIIFEIARIAFADIGDYVSFGPDGVVLDKSFAEMPEGATRCIADVQHHFNAEGGGSARFKLHNKLDALKLLGDHYGLWDAQNTRKKDNPLAHLTDNELLSRVRKQLKDFASGIARVGGKRATIPPPR